MFSVESATMIFGQAGWSLTGATLQPLEAAENKLAYFLERFPEYRKTLRLALTKNRAETPEPTRDGSGMTWRLTPRS